MCKVAIRTVSVDQVFGQIFEQIADQVFLDQKIQCTALLEKNIEL